jgi:DnaK suppressor protein
VTAKRVDSASAELRRRRRELLETATATEKELDGLRAAERGHELEEVSQTEQGAADLLRLGEAERLEIRRIDAALERIESGGYGTCAECGGAIEKRRLEALPWAVRCAGCAATQERAAAR